MRRNALPVPVLAGLAVVLVAGVMGLASCLWLRPGPTAAGDGIDVGDPAPEVTLKELATGEPLDVPGDLAGAPFGLLFFSYG